MFKLIPGETTNEIYIIIGGGAASVSAGAAIRRRNKSAAVVILTRENTYPIMRPALTKKLASDYKPAEFYLKPGSFYDKENILILTGREAVKIEPAEKNVILSDGSVFHYDKLIYAAGAESFVPPVKGADKKGVSAIRTYDDFEKVRAAAAGTARAAVIGGGVLGLEAASALKKICKKVTVLETSGRVMTRQLDEETSLFLQKKAEEYGVEIILNASVKEITGGESAEGILLENGDFIEAGAVVLSCGVRANTALAQNAGIETGRAVKVNKFMETNIPGIYACGDCAEFRGINYALWAEASEMGKIAGENAAGGFAVYEEQAFPLAFNGFNTSLYVLGTFDGEKTERTETASGYIKKFYSSGKLCGFILAGDVKKSAELTAEMKSSEKPN